MSFQIQIITDLAVLMVIASAVAFIVAKTGQDLGVISDFVLPIIGVATIITACIKPYLIKFSFKEKGLSASAQSALKQTTT